MFFMLVSSCNNQPPKELNRLTSEWEEGEPTYCIYTKYDSSIVWINCKDSIYHSSYFIRRIFRKKINTYLNMEKVIVVDSKDNKRIESYNYIKNLGNDLISKIDLSYDFETKSYSASRIDSVMTEERREQLSKRNKLVLDSIIKDVKKNNSYLCGTARNEILMKDIFEHKFKKSISKDSALAVIELWKNEL